MNECDINGMGGDCGFECSAFLQGDCEIANDIAEDADPEDLELYQEIYGGQHNRRPH